MFRATVCLKDGPSFPTFKEAYLDYRIRMEAYMEENGGIPLYFLEQACWIKEDRTVFPLMHNSITERALKAGIIDEEGALII